jgi:hypothetical protein
VCAILAVGASAYLWIPMVAEAPLTSRMSLVRSQEEIPLYRTNAALMGAWIPAGVRRVRLEFRPLWWRESLGLSALAWVGILGRVLVAMHQGRRRRERRGAA